MRISQSYCGLILVHMHEYEDGPTNIRADGMGPGGKCCLKIIVICPRMETSPAADMDKF